MKYSNPDIPSSYRKNDLGKTLYDLVLSVKPNRIVEFGVLHGYSTVAMAMALDELGKGKIKAYDLWDDYEHNHGVRWKVMVELMNRKLGKYVDLCYGDFQNWDIEPCDMIHLDISNDGKTIRKAFEKIRRANWNGVFVFEGGSLERDEIEWMKKYKKLPISKCGVPYRLINSRFPSLSIL